jgi:hypothetical protein
MKWKGFWRKPNLRWAYYLGIRLEELRKTTKNLSLRVSGLRTEM